MLQRVLIPAVCVFVFLASAPLGISGTVDQPLLAAGPGAPGKPVDLGCAYFHFLRGRAAELGGRHGEAVHAYEEALLCDPGAGPVMRALAMLLVRMEQREQAVGLIKRIIALDPQDTGSRVLLASLYSAMERTEEAVAIYREILAEEPGNFNVMLLLGGLYARARDYGQARQVLEKLVETSPDSYAGQYYLARLYLEMGLVDEAADALGRALALSWSAHHAQEAAEIFEQAERFDAAISIYERILRENPGDERARGRLASIYLKRGQVAQALRELDVLRDRANDPASVELVIARILIDNAHYPEAIARLTGLLREDPGFSEARTLLILASYHHGDLEATKKILALVKPGDQAYEESVLMLARVLQEEKDFSAAEQVLMQAMADEGSRRLNFYVALAMLFFQQDRSEEGHAIFRQAFVDFPAGVEPYYEYGLFLHKIKDPAGALLQMKEVLHRDPNHAYALNFVGYTWADEGRNLEQAREYIEQAVALLPHDGFVRDSLGWVYYRLGDFVRAVEELELAAVMSPDDPTIQEHLGDAHLKNGDIRGARAAYARALKLYEEEGERATVRSKLAELPTVDGMGQ
jgi:tetratricopeptide (TPR) repeat protein